MTVQSTWQFVVRDHSRSIQALAAVNPRFAIPGKAPQTQPQAKLTPVKIRRAGNDYGSAWENFWG